MLHNLSFFPAHDLPGESIDAYPTTGIGSYAEVFRAAETILEQCEHSRCTTGWQPVGPIENGLGVFVWATHSREMKIMSMREGE